MADNQATLKDTFKKSETIFVLVPQNPTPEMVAAGLGVYQSLKASGKQPTIATPTPLTVNLPFPGAGEIQNKIGNRNLVITLKVDKREAIDKVSYNLDEENHLFNLIVQPKKGNNPLQSDNVSFSYSGAQADLVIVIGAARLEQLGIFYEEEKELFADTPVLAVAPGRVNFATSFNTDYVAPNLAVSSMKLLRDLEVEPANEAATNILAALEYATNRFLSPEVTPDTFELVARLMRAGGERISLRPVSAPSPVAPQVNPQPTAPQPPAPVTAPREVPDEWLAPKIYKAPPQAPAPTDGSRS